MQPPAFLTLGHSHYALVPGFQYPPVKIVKPPGGFLNRSDVVSKSQRQEAKPFNSELLDKSHDFAFQTERDFPVRSRQQIPRTR
ncbi:MAG TPA: hypothetical protein VMR33_13480 [Candidatus Baltobacteraceae bacterium]|nr:hypothetical protein [Candidatus Baltobacteraceae bacterium]